MQVTNLILIDKNNKKSLIEVEFNAKSMFLTKRIKQLVSDYGKDTQKFFQKHKNEVAKLKDISSKFQNKIQIDTIDELANTDFEKANEISEHLNELDYNFQINLFKLIVDKSSIKEKRNIELFENENNTEFWENQDLYEITKVNDFFRRVLKC